jgi:hypothetical protein
MHYKLSNFFEKMGTLRTWNPSLVSALNWMKMMKHDGCAHVNKTIFEKQVPTLD